MRDTPTSRGFEQAAGCGITKAQMKTALKNLVLTGCALAAGCLHAAGQTSPRREAGQASPRWVKAWEAAGAISSPHDAGAAKAGIAALAAAANQGALLRGWRGAEVAPWVGVYCEIMEAWCEALHGSRERHLALLLDASNRAKAFDEWDQDRLAKPALRAMVAGDWQKDKDFERLKAWAYEDELNRMPAVIDFFGCGLNENKTVAGGIFDNAQVSGFLELAMGNIGKFSPRERMKVLARIAPLLASTKWAEPLAAELEGMGEELAFEALLDIARIEAGLGLADRADARIARAERMLEAGETGDCLAPWARLAEAKIAAGRKHGEIMKTFETGIARAGDRPGYLKGVAEALTWAAWASHGDGADE